MAAQDYYPSTGLNLQPPALKLATLSIRLRWNCLPVVVGELAVSYIIITLSPQNGQMEFKLPSRFRVIITHISFEFWLTLPFPCPLQFYVYLTTIPAPAYNPKSNPVERVHRDLNQTVKHT